MNLQKVSKKWFFFVSLTMGVFFLFTGPIGADPYDPGACAGIDPTGYWELEEEGVPSEGPGDFENTAPGGGNTGDCSASGEHVCPVRTAADGGRIGYGQTFTAASKHGVDVDPFSSIQWDQTDDFSIELWMKSTKSASTTTDVLVGRTTGGAAVDWFVGFKRNGAAGPGLAQFFLQSNAGGDFVLLQGATDVLDGNWHHLVAVRQGGLGGVGTNRLYVDGVLEAMTPATYSGTFVDGSAIMTIGYLNRGSFFHFTGTLDEVAVYDNALVDQEIQAHYINGMNDAGYCTPLAPVIDENTPTLLESAAIGFDYEGPIFAGGNPISSLSLDANAPYGMTVNSATDGSWAVNWAPAGSAIVGDNTFTVIADNGVSPIDSGDYTIPTLDLCAAAGAPMIAYWELEEEGVPSEGPGDFENTAPGGGNTGDCSASGEHVCPVRTAADGGRIGYGQTFTAASKHGVDVDPFSSIQWDQTDDFSIELWMKSTKSAATTTDVLVGRTTDGTAVDWFVGFKRNGAAGPGLAQFFLQSNAGGDFVLLQGATDVLDGNWHHLVAVRQGGLGGVGTNRLYVDGVLEAMTPATYSGTFVDGSAIMTIGYLNRGSFFHFTGTLDEVAVYNVALSGAMIRQHFSMGDPLRGYCNLAPSITASGTLNYTEGQGAVSINPTIAVSDPDDDTLSGATITISSNYQGSEDTLAFTNTANISGNWNSTTGQLVLSGSDTVANYQAALKAVSYANAVTDPTTDARTVTYAVHDGYYYNLTPAVSTITISRLPNNPPEIEAPPSNLTVEEENQWVYVASATDLDGDTLTWSLNGQPAGMVFAPSNVGETVTITWTPGAGVTTSGPVTLTVSDGQAANNTDSITFTVSVTAAPPTNNAPEITSTLPALTVDEGSTWTYNATAADLDGDTLNWTLSPNPAGMTLSAATGNAVTVSWTPGSGVATSGSTTLTVSDGTDSASQNFTVTVNEADGGGGGGGGLCFIGVIQ